MTAEVQQEMVTIKIDGKEMSVPKGTLIIRAAEKPVCIFRVFVITHFSAQ